MKPHRLFFFFILPSQFDDEKQAAAKRELKRLNCCGEHSRLDKLKKKPSDDLATARHISLQSVMWYFEHRSVSRLELSWLKLLNQKKKQKKKHRSVTRVLDRGIYRKGWVCSRAASTCVGERKKGAACVWSHIWSGWRCWLQSLFWWLAAWTCKFKTGDFTWLNTHWLEWLVFANFMYLPICFTSGCYISWFKCDVILYYI